MNISDLKQVLFENYQAGIYYDEDLVQIIEHAAGYLNLKTRTNTAKYMGKSYNGIKNFSNHDLIIDGVKFYINND